MAGAYLDQAAAVAVEKELYDDQTVRDMAYKDNTWFAMVKKNPNAGGRDYPMPVIFAPSQGGGANFSQAQSNQAPPQSVAYQLVNLPYYGIGTVQRQTILSMKTNKMAFVNALEMATNGALADINNSIACFGWRTGTGSVAKISSITASGLATLVNASDTMFFERNRVMQANPTDGGNTPRSGVGYVTAVNRQAGTVQFSTAQGGANALPSGWANGDYLVRQGDINAVPAGILAWLPNTDTTNGGTAIASNDSFLGVNRSVDTRLYGVVGSFAGESFQEAAVDHSMLIDREGGRPTHWFLNDLSFPNFVKELGSKVIYEPINLPDSEVGFEGIEIHGAKAKIMVVADRNVPVGFGGMLQMDTWELVSIGDTPHIQGIDDGEEFFRVYNADARELRTSAYWSVGCGAPGWNGMTLLPV